jgi:hypothetical protein
MHLLFLNDPVNQLDLNGVFHFPTSRILPLIY